MLKVDLKLFDNVIVGKILEQDESLRGKGKIFSDGKVNICSNGAPELNDLNLFIRGELRNNDNDCFCYSYDSAGEAKEYYDAFLKAIEKINKKDDELWLPEYGGDYYRTVATGEVVKDRNTGSDEDMFDANNVFKSKEVADKVVKSTKLHWLLWRLKEKYCPDCEFGIGEDNVTLYYVKAKREWDSDIWSRKNFTTPRFSVSTISEVIDYLNSHKELWEDLI